VGPHEPKLPSFVMSDCSDTAVVTTDPSVWNLRLARMLSWEGMKRNRGCLHGERVRVCVRQCDYRYP
jgi:hypothetical protein